MDNVRIAMFERRGRILSDAMKVIHELAKSPLADEDKEGEDAEQSNIKDLIIRSRTIVEQDTELSKA